MDRRTFLNAASPLTFATLGSAKESAPCAPVVWSRISLDAYPTPSLQGFTDCVPDIVGWLGRPIDLAIFTEGNHFPALLGPDILTPFRERSASDPRYSSLSLANIVVVTLPQPVIVRMIETGGIQLGNLGLAVDRASGFYPDIVMGGIGPLKLLYRSGVLPSQARVFARSRGPALLVAAGNPRHLAFNDLTTPGLRIVMATPEEPGARGQYLDAVENLLGREARSAVLRNEVTTFPGRLAIQHRDVLQAVSAGLADVGIIVRHLAEYFAATYPELCSMVPINGADRFSATIAMTPVRDPPRATAAEAFSDFFFSVAQSVYPHHSFATLSEGEFGAMVGLE